MAWIKRNLFFFIGGLVALGLLGGAGYYNYTNWSRNATSMDTLNQTYETLKSLNDPSKSPGDKNVDKIKQAKDQEKQVREWVEKSRTYFEPIPAIPAEKPVSNEAFAAGLRKTIDQLQREAGSAVVLPSAFGFSFEAERTRVTFAPAGLDLLAVQLGEVKAITELLYAAGVNNLDSIQRVRVSDDDANGSQTDYLPAEDLTTTSGPATLTPYAISFRSFTPEIARVLDGFASSHHGFLIKSFNVSPATADTASQPTPEGPGPVPRPSPNPQAGAGLTTFLKEKLLRVTMEIEVVKLQPQK